MRFDLVQPPRPRADSADGQTGFTILELLVAMTVTLLLVVALMRVFAATATTWEHGEAQVDAYREARGALQIMARDLSATLQAAYEPPMGAILSPTDGTTTPVGALVPTLVLQRYNGTPDAGPKNEEVYCLTNIPNRSNDANQPATGYSTSSSYRLRPGVALKTACRAPGPHRHHLAAGRTRCKDMRQEHGARAFRRRGSVRPWPNAKPGARARPSRAD